MSSRLEDDIFFAGAVSFKNARLQAEAITDTMIEADAGIDQSKLEHQHRLHYGQNSTATTVTVPIFLCRGVAGTILDIKAGSIVACIGAATITIDLKKNGVSVLTAVITLDNANTARIAEAGSLSTDTLAAGDLLELVITATAGGGTLGTGLFVSVTVKEDAN